MVGALASHLRGPPGLRCVCCSMLVLFFAMKRFSPGTQVFPSPKKPTFPNSNSSSKQVNEKPLYVDALPPNRYLFYYFYCLFFVLFFLRFLSSCTFVVHSS